ncbi:MAG: hypothetical protein AB7O52_12965 [Planctomycetota bacterium]
MSTELLSWLREGPGLAVRLRGRGAFGGIGQVPVGVRAVDVRNDLPLLGAGAPLPDDAILVRDTDLSVVITVPKASDRGGFSGSFVLTVRVAPPGSRTAVLLLRDRVLVQSDRFGADDLAEILRPVVAKRLDLLLAKASWDGDGGVLEQFRADGFVETLLAEPLFEVGMSLRGVSGFAVESEALEEVRQRESEIRRETERIQRRLDFLELWKREETGQALAHAEVKRLASHLRREGLLREIEREQEITARRLDAHQEEARARAQLRRMLERERISTQAEIDSAQLEYEIERAKQLKEVLDRHGLLAIVGQLGDSPHASQLLELLVEKEMTPEQISARAGTRTWQRLEDRFAQLATEVQTKLAPPALARGGAFPGSELPELEEIWLAAGLSLYRLSAAGAFGVASPTPVLPPEDIGYLRSVTFERQGIAGVPAVLVGAQAGVAVYRPTGSFWSVHRYRPQPQGRGGANSVLLARDRLLASHSELGLHMWEPRSAAVSTPVFQAQITAGRSTRGIHWGPDRRAYFAHGEVIYHFDPDDGLEAATACGVLPDSVTSLASSREVLVAGTGEGRLYRARPGAAWQELAFRGSGPIFRVQPLETSTRLGWVVGARHEAVQVLDADGGLLEEYRSRYPIRWVAAGRQGVLGVDRFGQELLLWRWGETQAPFRRIRLPDQIQSFAVTTREVLT